jgi:hypothetical protein
MPEIQFSLSIVLLGSSKNEKLEKSSRKRKPRLFHVLCRRLCADYYLRSQREAKEKKEVNILRFGLTFCDS